VPLLWPLPDTVAGIRLLGKAGDYGAGTEKKYLSMKLAKDLLAFMYSLLDILAYRLTFC
jgi:hypothetical protein